MGSGRIVVAAVAVAPFLIFAIGSRFTKNMEKLFDCALSVLIVTWITFITLWNMGFI